MDKLISIYELIMSYYDQKITFKRLIMDLSFLTFLFSSIIFIWVLKKIFKNKKNNKPVIINKLFSIGEKKIDIDYSLLSAVIDTKEYPLKINVSKNFYCQVDFFNNHYQGFYCKHCHNIADYIKSKHIKYKFPFKFYTAYKHYLSCQNCGIEDKINIKNSPAEILTSILQSVRPYD